MQIKRYFRQYPSAKGKAVKKWILLKKHVPWKKVTLKQLNQLIRNLKSTFYFKENKTVLESAVISEQDSLGPILDII